MDPLRPDFETLVKLGSAIVHAEEALSPGAHPMDLVAFRSNVDDPKVRDWMKAMSDMALLPVKRDGPIV